MSFVVGLIVNPIAGIGGPAGLKGSDDKALEAIERGYAPTSHQKTLRFLRRLQERARTSGRMQQLRLRPAPGVMGAEAAHEAGLRTAVLGVDTGLRDPFSTSSEDTAIAAEAALSSGVDLLVFVGGDGTAADLMRAVGDQVPLLGVPAGVKMFSECFAETPESAADLVAELLVQHPDGDLPTQPAEILDLDETAYGHGTMAVRHHGAVRVPRSPRVQSAKCPACPQDGLDEVVGEVLLRLADLPDALCIIGSGSTTAALESRLGLDTSLIGIDVARVGNAVEDGASVHDAAADVALCVRQVAKDADANVVDRLVEEAQGNGLPVILVLSPIGGQGFIVGRGTGPLTPRAVQAALPDRLWVLATTGKLDTIEHGLHVDTGDAGLDRAFPRHLRVIIGVGRERVVAVAGDP